MKKEGNRTENTIRSTVVGLAGHLITLIVTFVYRTVFIHYLGSVYLGIQGLFSNILSMLALAELGISTAITFSLYKPIAQKDYDKIRALMGYFKKAYFLIAFVIGIAGIAISPFLDFFIKEPPAIKEPLVVIYFLYLGDTLVSYAFIHKQAIIRADQKVHIISATISVCQIIRIIIQTSLLFFTKEFIPILIAQIAITILMNVYLSKRADSLYPFLKKTGSVRLDKETSDDISSKIKSLFWYKIGAYVVNGTDNILISKFIGIVIVGVYSNYSVLLSTLKTLINYFVAAVTPSVGNYTATKPVEESERLFYEINFLFFWIFSLCTTMIFALINPFIELWIGSDYLLDIGTVGILSINFYLYGPHQNMLIYRNVLGLYVYCSWKPIAEAIINIIASLFFVRLYGLFGIFLGTTTSFVCTALWIEPYVLYKYYFKKSPTKYITISLQFFVYTVFIGIIAYILESLVRINSIFGLIVKGVLCLAVHTLSFIVVFGRFEEYISCKQRLLSIIARKTGWEQSNR